MSCCGVNQNGVLNMTYDIIEVKKGHHKNIPQVSETFKEHNKSENKSELKPSIHSSHHLQSIKLKSEN